MGRRMGMGRWSSSSGRRRRPEVRRQGVPQQRMGSEAGALVLQDHGGSSRGSRRPPLPPSLPLASSCPPSDKRVRVEAEPRVRIHGEEAQHVGQVRVHGHLRGEEGTRGLRAGSSSSGSSDRPIHPGKRCHDCLDRRHEGIDAQVARGRGRAAIQWGRIARGTLLAPAKGDAVSRSSRAQLSVVRNYEALESAATLHARAPEMVVKNRQKGAARGSVRNAILAKISCYLLEVGEVLGSLDCREGEGRPCNEPHAGQRS